MHKLRTQLAAEKKNAEKAAARAELAQIQLAAERERKPVILNSIPMFNEAALSATIAEKTDPLLEQLLEQLGIERLQNSELQKQLAAERGKVQQLRDALAKYQNVSTKA